jgi:hypothetical protein
MHARRARTRSSAFAADAGPHGVAHAAAPVLFLRALEALARGAKGLVAHHEVTRVGSAEPDSVFALFARPGWADATRTACLAGAAARGSARFASHPCSGLPRAASPRAACSRAACCRAARCARAAATRAAVGARYACRTARTAPASSGLLRITRGLAAAERDDEAETKEPTHPPILQRGRPVRHVAVVRECARSYSTSDQFCQSRSRLSAMDARSTCSTS